MSKIFVSLVAYMDNELDKTVQDIFNKAKNPKDITVGIVNQDTVDYVYKGEYNVKVINVTPKDSVGYSYCRVQCNQLMNKELYYFQIAPHSRLAKDWDETLINTYTKLEKNNKKFILVHRQHEYDLPDTLHGKPYYVSEPNKWKANCILGKKKQVITSKIPFEVKSFLAGGIFCKSNWLKDVPYNTDIFLWGEEVDLSVRTFSKGYKAFHLPVPVSYHLYGQINRKALGREFEAERYSLRNNNGLEYVFRNMLNGGYDKSDIWIKEIGLDKESLSACYNSFKNINHLSADYVNTTNYVIIELREFIKNSMNNRDYVKMLDIVDNIRKLINAKTS